MKGVGFDVDVTMERERLRVRVEGDVIGRDPCLGRLVGARNASKREREGAAREAAADAHATRAGSGA